MDLEHFKRKARHSPSPAYSVEDFEQTLDEFQLGFASAKGDTGGMHGDVTSRSQMTSI